MWEDDWALLGMAPTTDLGAIKKAYALKLKVTRPDDDAEAYQALRSAYDRAQQWAKWQAMAGEEEQEPPVDAIVDAPAVEVVQPLAEAAAEPAEVFPPPEPVVEPQVLIDRLEQGWRNGGEAELWALWPHLRTELNGQPLQRGVLFSAEFARWVLRTPQLPNAFVATLNDHFHWLSDFRTERLLGFDLAQALHQELDSRLLLPVSDPRLLVLAEPLQQLSDLHARSQRLWSQLLATLLQPQLDQAHKHLGASLLRRLGLDADRQALLRTLIRRAAWLRFGLLASVFIALSLLLGSGDSVIGATLMWAGGSWLLITLAAIGGLLLNSAPSFVTTKRRITLPLHAWRTHRSQPWLGLALMLLSAAGSYFAAHMVGDLGDALPTALGACALVGLWLAWPLGLGHGMVLAGLMPMVAFLCARWLLSPLPPVVGMLLGVTWLLVAAAVHEDRVPAPGLLQWPLRPVLNTLALVDRWGLLVALTPALAAIAYLALPGSGRSGSGIFLTWVFGNLVVGWLQMRADAWALKRLAGQPA